MAGGLDASRWAKASDNNRIHKTRSRSSARSPSTPSITLSASQSDSLLRQIEKRPQPIEEHSRFLKIIARLNWKLPFLKQGYSLAKITTGKDEAQIEAFEIQFKLDFHEFYMYIERALVRLMSIFGISVQGDGVFVDGSLRMNGSLDDFDAQDSKDFKGRPIQHWYHVNVLTALEDPTNPLNGVFGRPEVRKQLLRAKDLRNRWKNIDQAGPRRFKPPPLSTYNLEEIVQTILSAIDEANNVAVEYIRKNGGEPTNNAGGIEQQGWELMVDAMDWEAV
ncbi:hypothetical protein M426DRAFT_325967 [Hypoxylon sp. CI-4A]|nr:hypothetical protein M426DRAFT_325967 [Hypoxylon sp. CI-4A]